MKTILIIEDDNAIAEGLSSALAAVGFQTARAASGIRAVEIARRVMADAIILDLMLPGKNGLDICRELRQEGVTTPILMLTSRGEESEKVAGLEIGADDYMTKPFSVRELVARMKALLRRKGEMPRDEKLVKFGTVSINFKKMEARKNGRPMKLTTREFSILRYFLMRPGETVTRDDILQEIWGVNQPQSTRTIDNFVLGLRKKIEVNPTRPKHILTVHTSGYKFVK